jgi:SnoaL-like domain
VSAREVVESFWAAMSANDWDAAAALFSDHATIDWPCSGERMASPEAWAEVQRRYPAAGQ